MIGKGGREHALCWKLKQSPRVQTVFCAPGNAGTALDAQNVSIEANDFRGLIQFAKREWIDLTVVGPEEPLTGGIVDAFQREGLHIFGPRRDAAELEGSKVFAKELMRQAGIPTADYRIFRNGPGRRTLRAVRARSRWSSGREGAQPSGTRSTAGRPPRRSRRSIGSWTPERSSGPASRSNSRNAARSASSRRPPRPEITCSDGRSDGHQGRWTRGRQGGLRLRQPSPGARRDRPDHGPADLRQGRRPDHHRGTTRRPGDERPGTDRRSYDRSSSNRARITNEPTTTTRAPTPAGWGRIHPRRS